MIVSLPAHVFSTSLVNWCVIYHYRHMKYILNKKIVNLWYFYFSVAA